MSPLSPPLPFHLTSLKGREMETDRQTGLPSAGALPKCPQQSEPGQAKASSLGFNRGLPAGYPECWTEPSTRSPPAASRGAQEQDQLELGLNPGTLTSQWHPSCSATCLPLKLPLPECTQNPAPPQPLPARLWAWPSLPARVHAAPQPCARPRPSLLPLHGAPHGDTAAKLSAPMTLKVPELWPLRTGPGGTRGLPAPRSSRPCPLIPWVGFFCSW